MAHEISSVTIDGNEIFEAMYANRPAWHGSRKSVRSIRPRKCRTAQRRSSWLT